MSSLFWQRGQQSAVADICNISPQYFNDILHRRRGVSLLVAERLQRAVTRVMGYPLVSWEEWLRNRTSTHPAFFGDPKGE